MVSPPDPNVAAAPSGAVGQAPALLDLLLTVAYIDGVLHPRERTFVQSYLDTVLLMAEEMGGGAPEERARIRASYQSHYDRLATQLQLEIAALADEVEVTGDGSFLTPRLKLRALTIFRRLPPAEQTAALELVQGMMHADGIISQAEVLLYEELLGLFAPPAPTAATIRPSPATPASPAAGPAPGSAMRPMAVLPPHWNPLKAMSHPLLDPLEQTFSPHPVELQSQIAFDYQLVGAAMSRWQQLRGPGAGRLTGITDIGQLPVGAQFLDGHVHVLRPSRPTELIVIGDLHGCYSCLKAALLQSGFVNRVWLHQWDPQRYPDIKLVLLGDYIDRGYFSFDGVLRTVLQLLIALPEHVIVLRGNHEYYKSREGRVFSGVHPAEGLFSIVRHAPIELLEAYKTLFEQMPTSFLFDRTLFVHGGIPRDDSLASRYQDLSSLSDPELRFQMLWSDPVQTDTVPVALQLQHARFTFGKDQFRAFMDKVGCHTMIRGHEQITPGFEVTYDLGDRKLLNLFSAGGHDNRDLPKDSSYRKVTPMALTVVHDDAGLRAIPWPINYQPFNYDVHNGLYRKQPVLEYRNT